MTGSCIYCGEQLRPNSMFCFRCGQLVQVPQESQERSSRPAAHGKVGGAAPVRPVRERPADASAATPVFGAHQPAPPRWSPPRLSDNAPRRRADTPAAATPVAQAVPAAPVVPAAAPSVASTVVLTFSTGDRVIVVGNAVIGRKPQSEALNSGAQAIQIDDPQKSLSRVHLLLTVDERGASVTDPGSANGSSLERAGVVTRLAEGQPTVVLPGDRLWLGDVSADLTTA